MFGYPGWGHGSEQMPSGDPVLPRDLAGAFGETVARDIQTAEQMAALFTGQIGQKLDLLVEGTLTAIAKAALARVAGSAAGAQSLGDLLNRIDQHPGGAVGNKAPAWSGGAPPHNPPPQTTPPSSEPEPIPEGGVKPEPEGPEYHHPLQRYREARQAGASMTMGSVAKAVGAPIATYLNNHNPLWTQETQNGTPVLVRRNPATEEVLETVRQGDPHYNMVRAAIGARALATGIAGGSGVVGTLGAVATKFAGPIGAVVGGAQLIGGQLESQTQKAATYRQSFGEQGTGFFAAEDRIQEALAGLRGFGTIGGERAREQFKQASAMGLRGERRDQATDFATDMYMKFGMDTAESMNLVAQAVDTGNVSLKDFSDAITRVSRSAVAAGRSSKEAIEDFAQAQAVVSKNIVAGGASVRVTEQIKQMASALPKPLAESLGGAKGIAGWMTQQNIQSVAMLSGQDPMAAMWQMSNPATAQTAATQFFGNIGEQIVSLVAQTMGLSAQEVKRRVRRLTKGKRVSQEEQFSIFAQLAGGSDRAAGMAQQILAMVIGLFPGIQVDYAQMLSLFFEACQGSLESGPEEGGLEGAVKGLAGMFGGKGLTGKDSNKNGMEEYTSPYEALGSEESNIHTFGDTGSDFDKQRNKILTGLGYAKTDGYGRTTSDVPGEVAKTVDDYVNFVNKTGMGNPAIEALLGKANRKELLEAGGVKNLDDVTYRINGKDMTLDQILKRGNASDFQKLSMGQGGIVNKESGEVTSIGEVTNVRVELELTGEARDILRSRRGPSEDQRAGRPASGSQSAGDYSRNGGR